MKLSLASDLAELSSAGVKTLFWQVGQLENSDDAWRWKARFRRPSFRTSKLFRSCVSNPADALRLNPKPCPRYSQIVAAVAAADRGRELQIDYDSPDRLLPEYANAFAADPKVVPQLSIYGVAGWIANGFSRIGRQCAEMSTMFYDFEPDPACPVPRGAGSCPGKKPGPG
jgi:hypothetical protein